jgi:hypothetical protein
MGELSDSTNIAIALKVIEMGFKVLQFSTLKGQKAHDGPSLWHRRHTITGALTLTRRW